MSDSEKVVADHERIWLQNATDGEAQSSPEYWRSIYPDGNYPEGV